VFGCTNPVTGPEKNLIPEKGVEGVFNVTGVVTDDGKPVIGAVARLMKSGLFAITDADGFYKITGTGTGLAKRSSSSDEVHDTLVIKVATSNPGDSSEVVKTVVTSGVIMDLPPTYIVQREIRGYLTDDDQVLISKIEAYVYDKSVPDQVKEVNLWYDVVNDAFSSFAYFSSETNKQYTLYVKIYDNNGKFIGQSPDYDFTDNTGNIIFKNPFNVINAKPTITITVPEDVIENTKVKVSITAIDSFGGHITKCEVAVDDKGYADITSYQLAKRMTDNMVEEIEIVPATSSMIYVKATDDESNITIDSIQIKVRKPKISCALYIANGINLTPVIGDSIYLGDDVASIGDSIFIGIENFTCEDSLTIDKIAFGSLSNMETIETKNPMNAYHKVVVDSTGLEYSDKGNGYISIDYYCQVTMNNGSIHQEVIPVLIR
jgi:hypothetical protein